MNDIKKAVIPAAGLGTRMEPISSYLPKPMLPLGKKPVLQHIIEELLEAGVEEIAVVTRSEYNSVFEYFGNWPSISFVIDDTTSGPGGAILKSEDFIEGDDFVVVFSDAPLSGANRSEYLEELTQLKKSWEASAVVSLYRIPAAEISSRGVVRFGEQNIMAGQAVQLTDMLEKPSEDQAVSRWASACRYILDAHIFDALRAVEPDKSRELQLTPAIRQLIKSHKPVLGYPLSNNLTRHDTGNFEGYFEAFGDFTDS